MPTATTVVIGAGQAGLAVSRCLTERSIDHVLLERGDVAHSWRTGRWESLRLLTPNWQSRLPGYAYQGSDPDGYMDMPEVISFLTNYAECVDAPVQRQTAVTSVQLAGDDGYRVTTTQGIWHCDAVVIASGACNVPDVPALADAVPAGITSLTPAGYRNPSQLDEGGVLIAGASATGIQLADEIQRSGRPVTLAVGGHVRAPRVYRGRDIMWWLEAAGVLRERYDEVDDIVRARGLPSFQLIGSVNRAGYTLVPLSLYFNRRGIAKVELGLGKGKQAYDKRQAVREREWKRQKERVLRERG